MTPLPCPFCGEARPFGYVEDGDDVAFHGLSGVLDSDLTCRIHCRTCGSRGPRVEVEEIPTCDLPDGADFKDHLRAIEAAGTRIATERWNRRA